MDNRLADVVWLNVVLNVKPPRGWRFVGFNWQLSVRSSSVEILRPGPHRILVPRLVTQLSSDWSGIDIAFVDDWHDLCQSTANWCQSSFDDCEIRGGISDARRWVVLEATGVRRCVSPFPRSLIECHKIG